MSEIGDTVRPGEMMGHFQKHDRVSHARHGAGVVVGADERYTIVAFDNDGVRKFVTDLVRLTRSDLPLPAKPTPTPRLRKRPRARVAATEHKGTDSPWPTQPAGLGSSCVVEDVGMSKEAAIEVSEAKSALPETATEVRVPVHSPPEEGEVVGGPGSEEEADGYGHGV